MADDGTRLLVATGEAATSEAQLPRLVKALIDKASEVLVMTPRQERGLLDQIRTFGIPITVFELDPTGTSADR